MAFGDILDAVFGSSETGGRPVEPWREAIQKAKIGDAFFLYQSHSHSGGHRVNVIDYPESQQHDLEDMGPRNDSFQISGYVLGSNYITERDKLIKELKDSAAKNLTIPTEGIFRVKCTDWSVNETKEEQRIARFNMSFQLKETIEVITVGSTKQNIFDKKDSLFDKATEWFEKAYDISQKPVTAINNATETVDKCIDLVRAAKKVTGSVADFQRSVRELKGRAKALTLNARAMAQDVGGLVNFGTDPGRQGRSGDAEKISLSTSGTEQRIEMKNLQSQLLSPLVPGASDPSPLIQSMLVLQAITAESGLIAVSEFDSPQEALAEERDMIGRYDDLIDTIATSGNLTDDLYYAIRDIQEAVHDDLSQRVIRLPRLVIRQNNAERNALELNFSTYGNMDEYQSFNIRNGIQHPGFIPAMVDLQYKVGANE